MPVLPSRYFAPRYWASRYFGTRAPDTRAVIIQIADAVAAALEAATFAVACDVERAYVPVHDIKDLVQLILTVVPTAESSTPLTRGGIRTYDYVIDIGVQRKAPSTSDAFDPLILVGQQIGNLFRGRRLANYPQALCITPENAPIFSPAHADQEGVFAALVVLTFRVIR